MTLLRLLLSTFVLLAQAWPAHAVESAGKLQTASCHMGCCAAVAEMTCGCTETSVPAAPANVPPAGGRDLVPQVIWVAAEDTLPTHRADSMFSQTRWAGGKESNVATGPHVRLPVLFCSFLN